MRKAIVRTRSLVVVALICLAGATCGQSAEPESAMVSGGRVLKVAVLANGRITVDGSVTTLEGLRESFTRLAADKGEVWYYREAAQNEPPPEAMAVMQAIVENRLPVRLSTKSDYSDAVGPDGRAR
jgi:hypothetical protein